MNGRQGHQPPGPPPPGYGRPRQGPGGPPPGGVQGGRVSPQRYRPEGGPTGPGREQPPHQSGGPVPLLTHEEPGGPAVVRERAGGVAVAEHTARIGDGHRSRQQSSGRKKRKPVTPWRRVRRVLYVLLGLLVIGPFAAFVVGWIVFPVPSSNDAALTQVATFTFANGTPLATVRPENVNRVNVTLDKIPEHVRQAVLAAEDRTFYSNPGFDITGIGRAIYNQLTGGTGGGSTITQQYVKVSTGHDEVSLWRKYKEVVLAVKISREKTKDEILENYLNTIYLGRGASGIQAAAKAYFNKDVGDLTVSEGAMLAGAIQSPSNWDPAKNLEKSQERWNFVLDGMVQQGWLTPAERAQQTFPTNWLPEAPKLDGVPDDDRYHIYNQAVQELTARGISEDQINTEGLTVTTTVDQARQAAAVDSIKKEMAKQPDNLRSSLVSIDPRTGAILAYYGGQNGLGTDYAMALRQPGSSFKPFVLTAALESGKGVGLGSVYDGSSGQEFAGVTVDNSEGDDCAQCTVKTAMTKSINTIFYRLALDAGTQNVIDAAHKAGIPNDLLPEARGGIALGDQEVHPVDMASAFGTFAADGVHHDPYIVSKVEAADGRVLFDRTAEQGQQVIPQQVARNVTESMLDVASNGGIGLAGNRPVASKTGTVQQQGHDNKDAWMIGFTPSISTAVWVGTDKSDAIRDSAGRAIYGRMLPGQIWKDFMDDALKGTPPEQFSPFVPIGVPPTDEYSGAPGVSGTASPSDDDDEDEDDDSSDRRHGRSHADSDDSSDSSNDDEDSTDSFFGGQDDSGDDSSDEPTSSDDGTGRTVPAGSPHSSGSDPVG